MRGSIRGRLVTLFVVFGWLVGTVVVTFPAVALSATCNEMEPCPVEFGQPAFQAIANVGDAQFWTMGLSSPGGFRLEMTSVAPNYRLYVYGPDASLVGVTSRSGEADLVIELQDAPLGRYTVVVDVPDGQPSGTPYQLLAIRLLPSSAQAGPTEEWESNFGPVTLQLGDLTRPSIRVEGFWLQAPGTGACPPSGGPCRGVIRDGQYDRTARALDFTYYEDWVNLTGSARLILLDDGRTFAGIWTQPGSTGNWTLTRTVPSVLAQSR
jgi:hypothetical protein